MNTPSKWDLCPYEDPFNWFTYHAAMHEGMGQYALAAAFREKAFEWEARHINWHIFKANATKITDEVSRIMTARWAK